MLAGKALLFTGLVSVIVTALPASGVNSLDGAVAQGRPNISQASLFDRAAISVPLRIMPLGDSITWGSLSSSGNGYRGPLANYLAGVELDFVGSRRNGNMADNDNEGHSGSFLSEILEYSLLSVAARPNLILLHAGTNDMDLNRDVSTAPDRLEAIIDQLFDKCPDASILVAQIIFSTDTAMQARTDSYNAAITRLVSERQDQGHHIMAVDMTGILTTADLADKKHPNDSGYTKMAASWYNAIQKANDAGWIQEPTPYEGFGIGVGIGIDGITAGNLCTGSNWIKQGTVADLTRVWSPQGQVATGVDGATRSSVVFGDIDGDGLDDYLVVFSDGSVKAWRNTGNIPATGKSRNWEELGTIASGVGQPGAKVRFADVDGDGRVDYLILYDDGAVDAWRNTGNIVTGTGRKFESVGTIATGVGEPGSKVRFADIDGDGRADYLVLYDAGSVRAWRNTGNLNKGTGRNFEELGEVAAGVSGVPGSKVRLLDYDGDGLADYLILYDGGAVVAYRNTGNLGKDSSQKNFESLGTVATGVSDVSGESVEFADLNGDGLADYMSISDAGAINAWLNTGRSKTGGAVRFADLNGDGLDDLLWVSESGAVDAWLNAGGSPQSWTSVGQVATGVDGATASNVVFADLDGDRLDDYIVVRDDGSALGYRNSGNLDKSVGRVWEELGVIATGVGAAGDKVRFADVNKDRIADYLVVWDTGAVDVWLGTGDVLNDQRNFNKLGRIAAGVGAPGSKVRFADIDGDGLDDYLVVWDGGAVEAWRNNGNLERQPELPSWEKLGVIAAGVENQGIVQLGDLNGDNKADYLNIDSETGAVTAYINQCAGSSDPDVVPPDDQGSSTGDWTSIECTNDAVTDASINPTIQWTGVYAPQAWDIAMGNWRANPNSGGLSFSAQVSNFFNGPEGMRCELTADHNGCNSFLQCHDTNHPAGYKILNSMVALNNLVMNFYSGIVRTQAQISATAKSIQTTFAVLPSTSQAFKILLDVFSLGIALGLAPGWNVALRRLPYFAANGNELGTLKDTVNTIVTSTITIVKDKAPTTAAEITTALEELVAEMCAVWYESISELHTQLFDGSDSSISTLDNLFKDGKLLGNAYQPLEDLEIQDLMSKALYALLIPQAWALSPELGVVVLDANVKCGTTEPLKDYLSTEDGNASWVCYNDRMYFLAAAKGEGKGETCETPPVFGDTSTVVPVCEDNLFSLPPGLDKLNGKDWAGLTKEEIVQGAVNTFIANGGKNGGESVAATISAETIGTIQDMNITTPGVILLPVCGAEEARENWKLLNGKSLPNYPCN